MTPPEPDLLVVGSGLAAAAAAVTATRQGARVVCVESNDTVLRGMLPIDAAPLAIERATGGALDAALFGPAGLRIARVSSSTEDLRLAGGRVIACDPFGTVLAAATRVVLASGGDEDDDDELRPFVDLYVRGLSQCAWSDAPFHRGRPVVVYGNADHAGEEALHALAVGCRVEIISPGAFALKRASVRAALRGRVQVREHAVLDTLLAEDGKLARVRVVRDGRREEIEADAFFHARELRISDRLRALADAAVAEVGAVLAGETAGVPAWHHAALVESGRCAAARALG